MDEFSILPVGTIHRRTNTIEIEIFEAYADALLGLNGFSHVHVLYWLHENDTPEKRAILRVHPRRNPANPLTGVFATHSPVRPNPIALSLCHILSVEGRRIRIQEIDALDGSPVIDIKGYIPYAGEKSDIRLPDWV